MYAAAGGASLASRQARQRQRQQKRNQQLQAKLHPPKPSSSITEQSAITPTRTQSRQFHQLPTSYLRTSQTQARKLSAAYTTQSKLLLPIDESDNHVHHFHSHSHPFQSHQYPLYQSPYQQHHSHGVSSRKLVHRHSGSGSTNIYQLKLSKSATATLPLVSQMEASPQTTPSGAPEGKFNTAPNLDVVPYGHTPIHTYNNDAIIITPATPMASPGHVRNLLNQQPEVLTDKVGKTEAVSSSAVMNDEDQIKHQRAIQQGRKCSVYRMRRNEERQDIEGSQVDSASSSIKHQLRDLQLSQKQVQYEPLLSNESHLCYKGLSDRRKWQLCAYCEEGLCVCEHIEQKSPASAKENEVLEAATEALKSITNQKDCDLNARDDAFCKFLIHEFSMKR